MNDSFHKISLYMISNIFPISITLTNIFTVLYQYRDQHKKVTDSSELQATISFHTIYGTSI